MDECFLGQIQAVGFGFAPKGWALCQGQLMAIAQNQALFALLGTTFGGNGVTTFALPDLRARVPIGTGQGPGLSNQPQGSAGGAEQVTLTMAQLPPHTHALQATMKVDLTPGEAGSPVQGYLAAGSQKQFSTGPKDDAMQANSVSGTLTMNGGNQPHENRQPYIAMNYAIALVGIFPSHD
jgi:microcystin-dependent protein